MTRGPKGIQLTEAGGILYRHAEAILRHVEFAKQDAISALDVPSGRVSIGFPGVLAPLLAYELFVRVRTVYPQIVLHVGDANTWLLRERLVNGRCSTSPSSTPINPSAALRSNRSCWRNCSTSLRNRIGRPFGSPMRRNVRCYCLVLKVSDRQVAEEAFKKHGLTITSIGEINTLNTLRRAVASGIGNAILSWAALYDGEGKVALNCRRFADAKLVRPVALCFSEVGQRSPAIEAVAVMLKSLIYELIESGTWQGASLIAPSAGRSVSAATQIHSEFRMPAADAGSLNVRKIRQGSGDVTKPPSLRRALHSRMLEQAAETRGFRV